MARSRHHLGQERSAARRGAARRRADLRDHCGPRTDTFERPIYAGNAIATVQSSDPIKVITVRATGFEAVPAEGGDAVIEHVAPGEDAGLSRFVVRNLRNPSGRN